MTDRETTQSTDVAEVAEVVVAEPAAPAESAAVETAPAGELKAPAPVPVASTDPGRWGRVDESGTVFVKTVDGERAVGSWQAGEPTEGLAHYARRFDDIRTEVELLEARIVSGAGDPKQSLTSAKHIKESLVDAAAVGDLAALEARVEYVLAHAKQAIEASKQAREAARAASVARKQELAEEAERIAAESTQWKAAGDRLRTILDEWKTIRGVDRKTDEQLWRRFSKARDTFNRRRGSHFADLDRQRSTAKARKQELVEEAEQLADSDDWGPTAGRYKALMTEWKAAGRAPKDSDDALWQRFRAAQDKFFARRSAAFSERDAEFHDNARAKEELLAEAEKINISDLDAARSQLHRIQERWESIGKVPRERVRELEGRLRAVEEKVRQAADQQWRRTDPEAQARAAQFRERVEEFESKAAKARAAGDNRRAEQAEAQAAQWREWLAAAEQAVATR
ncbi:DUF349 domain-containing protein [Kibdelosporangium persicum]|uniref:ATPase involved in DNA repair n=1 Tax=Kibdelosporangium persicum TaxID=2698649 RepID=A0ABX2FAY9_9PSEU|nr:DUF349 domain-containing protein [Kibdelosporangium persicum]NRN68090.1 ATPase involved in DNA repair [Kibdelosporangium persicum]